MNPKLTASLLILAAVLANVGFTALGSIFNYPDVLDEPAGRCSPPSATPGRRQRLVLGARALRRAVRARSRSASAGSRRTARCGSRCRSGSPPPSCR